MSQISTIKLSMNLPKAKTENIVVQQLNDETLIYNLTTNQAFCLNETAAKVFELCDGIATFDKLKTKYQLTDEIIYLALDGLKKDNLIESDYVSPFAGMNRREVIKKVGLTSMITLPILFSLVAPSAAQAASVCINPGKQPAGYDTGTRCNGTQTNCNNACNDEPSITAQCCSNMATASPGCSSAGITCTCVCK